MLALSLLSLFVVCSVSSLVQAKLSRAKAKSLLAGMLIVILAACVLLLVFAK